jgi:protein-S-isoprenylcysteine O-methyltransferase Ste14
VPLGFLFAVAYLWLAHPTWFSLAVGSLVIVIGLGIRAAASGHIRKNAQLAMTGPYAHTRNPLYLGSIVMAMGFIVAARGIWIGVAALALFLFIYLPVIQAEEAYLRSAFPEYLEYSAQVPRFWPRLTAYRAGAGDGSPAFSRELYMQHREYNAIVGSTLILGALILKMVLM